MVGDLSTDVCLELKLNTLPGSYQPWIQSEVDVINKV